MTAAGWVALSWQQYDERARRVGRALMALGHQAGEAVGIIARNRTELVQAQLGIMNAGGVPVPIYKTSTAEQIAWILQHAGARIALADGEDELARLTAQRAAMPRLEKLVLFDEVAGRDAGWTLGWEAFLGLADQTTADALEARLEAVDPEAMAFLCYTSGTTGVPKGVMLSHASLMHVPRALFSRFGLARERILSYLPLSHIAEQLFSVLLPLTCGGEVFFCDDMARLRELLPEVRPTIFLGVPRVWEKFQAGLRARLAEATGLKAWLARWALATELACFRREVQDGRPVRSLRRRLARKLVISRIHARLGLDQVRVASTGSAPTPPATLEVFGSLGLPLHEGYGMTETSALLTTSLPGRPIPGAVGQALDGVELKIAGDGEILARGPNLTKGYFKEEEQTRALWEDGWLHTGDVGELDAKGTLRITDRKKDLLKTSGGKYISPQAVEAKLKAIRGIGQAVVIGDNRKYVSALLALDPESAPQLATELGAPAGQGLAALAKDERLRAHLDRCIADQVNAGQARFESIKRFTILPGELSVAGGELTPTLKLKRKAIATKYAAEIDALYPADEPAGG